MSKNPSHQEYWRRNVRLVGLLLTIWFLVSFVFGILLAEPLNAIRIPEQGSSWASGLPSRDRSTSSSF